MLRQLLATGLLVLSNPLYARCNELAQGFQDVIPNHADAKRIVGQDFDTILERGTLYFAVYNDFAPFSWLEEGQAKGVDIEIAKIIAAEIGVEARFNFFSADESVDADFRNQIWRGPLINGTVSNVMMHAPYNKDLQCRNEFVVLGGQYYNERLATAYRIEAFPDEVPTPAFYRFHKVGVENHTLPAFYLENFGGGALLSNIQHYPNEEDAFDALEKSDVDAVMAMKSVLEFLDDSEEIAIGTPPLINFSLDQWTIGVAVNFRYRELFYTVDGIIADMIGDGRMEKTFSDFGINYQLPDY